MSTDVISIEEIKQALAQLPQDDGVDDETRSIAGISGNKRISLKGSVFRKVVGGKEVAKIEERHMNVIFVKASPSPSRVLYKGAFTEDKVVSPDCWSTNNRVPDVDVEQPPAATCDSCPYSVKGSSSNGKSSACRLQWRTAVVLPNHPEGDVMQLVIPSASIWGDGEENKYPFKAYARFLETNNISLGRVITKMQFDLNATAPRVLFSAAGYVSPEMLPKLKVQAHSKEAENAVKFTVFKQDGNRTRGVGESVVEVIQPTDVELVVRAGTKKVETEMASTVPDIINKWKNKGE